MSKQSKSGNGTAILALIVGGGAIAALAIGGPKPTPTPTPPATDPISKRIGFELKARAIAGTFPAGGPTAWLSGNTTQKSWNIDPATNSNGNIQTNTIVFDDSSQMSLLVDRYGRLAYRASDSAEKLLEDWTQPGFEPTTDATPIIVLTAEKAGTDLKTGHRAADWIDTHYATSISSKVDDSKIGRGANYATHVYSFRDGSSLDLEIVSESPTVAAIGSYSFTAKNALGGTLLVFSEPNFIPYVSPSLQSSLLYVQIYNAVNAYNLLSPSAKNIVGEWLRTMGAAGASTLEQSVNGIAYKGRQYDMTIYTSVIPEEPNIAADLYYDRSSTVSAMYFYITLRFISDPKSTIKTHDTYPNYSEPYDRTKTNAWVPIAHMINIYMTSDKNLLTPDHITARWSQHCTDAAGLSTNSLMGNEYIFPDGSSARLTAWTELARQFRILMSYTDPQGVVRDDNYPALLTDYWRVSPSPAPFFGRGHNANDWLSSYLRAFSNVQLVAPPAGQANPYGGNPWKQILTINNYANIIDVYGTRITSDYNRLYADQQKWVIFDHGELDVSSSLGYFVHYIRFRDTTYTYLAFVKYYQAGDSTGQRFPIQIITTVGQRYQNGTESMGALDYWNGIRNGTVSYTIFYSAPGF